MTDGREAVSVIPYKYPDAAMRFREALELLEDPTVTDKWARTAYWQVLKRSWQMMKQDAQDCTPSDVEPRSA